MAYAPDPQQMGVSDEEGAKAPRQKVEKADIQGIEKCIFNFPCVGGCCAPTVNPDPTCAKRGSNEFTLPANGVYLKVAPVIEYSRCCIFCGSIGLDFFARNRSHVMCFAFVVSLIGWFFTGIAAVALTTTPSIVIMPIGHWATGELVMEATDETIMQMYIGVQMRVERVDCSVALNTTACLIGVSVPSTGFSHFHDDVYIRGTEWSNVDQCGAAPPVEIPAAASAALSEIGALICGECKTNAQASVQLLIMALITQIPQMTTDMQRRTPFGDVNCQATMGAITSVFGCLSTLGSLSTFANSCLSGLPTEVPGFDFLKMRWSRGRAFNCLIVATILKLVDALCHFLTPTPRARWQKPPADIESLEEFLMLAA